MVTVLIGVVSRGTGTRGNCGGLDNATHYVRVKMFVKWIMVSQVVISSYGFYLLHIYCTYHKYFTMPF